MILASGSCSKSNNGHIHEKAATTKNDKAESASASRLRVREAGKEALSRASIYSRQFHKVVLRGCVGFHLCCIGTDECNNTLSRPRVSLQILPF